MQMTKTALLAATALFAVMSAASAEEYKGFQAGDIMVRGRGLFVMPTVSGHVTPIRGDLDASMSVVPEADLTYFFTPNISVEAIAAITRHHVRDRNSTIGTADLGRVTLLPPTVTAQYHFLSQEAFSPYVGAGINYTVFFDHTLPEGGAVTKIHYDNTFAPAIQVGADYHLQGKWYLNFDVKHIFLKTHVKINDGAIAATANIDPTIVGLGVGYKF